MDCLDPRQVDVAVTVMSLVMESHRPVSALSSERRGHLGKSARGGCLRY